MAKKYSVKLLRKEKLAKDTWLFAFEKPEGYTFIAGQYHTFSFPLPNGKNDWRDMTITSSPQYTELWLVTRIKEASSLFKKTLLDMPIGLAISLEGPSGGFVIQESETRPHVFLAGGIGVNVFHSILMDAAGKKLSTPMTLIVSFSSKEHSIFNEELNKISTKNKDLKIHYVYERISEKLLGEHLSSILDNVYMIAGGQDFVDAINDLLLHMGVSRENIRIDYFTGY